MNYSFLKLLEKAVFISLLFFVLCLFLVKVDLKEDLGIHYSKTTYPLNNFLKIGQSFTASRENLAGVALRFKKINDVEHDLFLDVYRGEVKDVRKKTYDWQVKFSSSKIKNDMLYNFYIPNQPNSKNEKFTFYLTARSATESASVSPIVSKLDSYVGGEAYLNGEQIGGDVFFRPVYRVNLFHFFGYFLNRIAFGKPRIFGKETLFLLAGGLFIGYFLLVFIIFEKVYKKSKKKDFIKLIAVLFLIIVSFLILYYRPRAYFKLSENKL